jgi:hypothetical protein
MTPSARLSTGGLLVQVQPGELRSTRNGAVSGGGAPRGAPSILLPELGPPVIRTPRLG